MPYGVVVEAKFDNVIASINTVPQVRFVVHTGDVKAGSERCDDALLQKRFDQFQTFRDGVIVTPGDNDWTDCHRINNGNYLPTERLAKFREIFYPVPGMTGGQHRFPVRTQAAGAGFEDYVENMMWSFNGAMMATVHVVGSNNGLEPWNQIDPSDSYAAPRKSAGVMIAMQANPNFDLPAADQQRQGFNKVLERITQHAVAFGKPVLLAHGDSHYFRVDKPLAGPVQPSGSQMLENVTRVENFGAQNVHWVEVFVNPRDPNVFRVEPRIVKDNLFAR